MGPVKVGEVAVELGLALFVVHGTDPTSVTRS
jgi:hypothetical protein